MPATERTPGSRSRRVAAIVAALVIAHAGSAWADYKSDYADGLEAAKKGQWAEAEAKMRAALSQESTPAARVNLYGRVYVAYAPQYFLGIAAYRRGDCDAAVRNLEHGPTRSVVSDSKSAATVKDFTALAQKGLSECRTLLASREAPKPPVAEPKPTPPVVPTQTPTRPIADTRPTPTPTPAPPKPEPAKPVVVAKAPEPKPAEPARPAAPKAPPALAAAVESYLRGRYDQVSQANPATLPDDRARFHLLLLRSASRHTLAQIQGPAGAQLLAQAEADVRAAKQLQPGKAPDAALFSPRYRAFFSQTR